MRQVLAYILGPIVGTVVYSISVIVNSIIIGDIEPTIPGIFLFTFGNIAAFIVMAKFAKWLSPNRNGSYRVSVFLYSGFTIWGMIMMNVYPFYYYIVLSFIGFLALFHSQDEISVQKNIGDE